MPSPEPNLSSNLEDSDKQEEDSLQSAESLKDIARLVEEGKDAIYRAPTQEATGCPTIPGVKPQVLGGKEAIKFMTETIPRWCSEKRGAFVILGNEKEDITWTMNCLEKKTNINKELITVYSPECDADIEHSEQDLLLFLQNSTGCLVTLGRFFSGVESATVIFVYSNPYASNFREH